LTIRRDIDAAIIGLSGSAVPPAGTANSSLSVRGALPDMPLEGSFRVLRFERLEPIAMEQALRLLGAAIVAAPWIPS
jgi:hypothetical protein